MSVCGHDPDVYVDLSRDQRDIYRRRFAAPLATITGVPLKKVHPLLKRVGTRLRRARHAKGLSQEAVALAAGMDRSYVSGLERGEFNVSVLALARIARVTGVPLATLFEDN